MRKAENKEVWCIWSFGNFPDIVRGDVVEQIGLSYKIDFLDQPEPDVRTVCGVFVYESELAAYVGLRDYLSHRLESINKTIIRLGAGNNK